MGTGGRGGGGRAAVLAPARHRPAQQNAQTGTLVQRSTAPSSADQRRKIRPHAHPLRPHPAHHGLQTAAPAGECIESSAGHPLTHLQRAVVPAMAAAITSWVLNPIQSLTMSRPRTRKLWCAVSGNLMRPFSIECVADQDDIEKLMKRIWEEIKERIKDTAPHYSNLTLYSPVVQLNDEEKFRIDYGEFLHPRRMITSLFPKSKDPDVDIVVVSGDITTWKWKHSESQSGENIHS